MHYGTPSQRRNGRAHASEICQARLELDGLTLSGLASPQERFWRRAVAADFERTEVLVPIAFRHPDSNQSRYEVDGGRRY